MKLVLSAIVLLGCIGAFDVVSSAQTDLKPKDANSQLVRIRPEFQELALIACRAIQRIPVLEQSAEIYDRRLEEAQKALDKTDFAALSPVEKSAVASLNSALARVQAYRGELEAIQLRRKSEDEKDRALYSGPPGEVFAQTNATTEADAIQALSARIESDHSLDTLFDSLKNGNVSDRPAESMRNLSGTYISDDHHTEVVILQTAKEIEIRKTKDLKDVVVWKGALDGSTGTFTNSQFGKSFKATARATEDSLFTESMIDAIPGAPTASAVARARWHLSPDGITLYVENDIESSHLGSSRNTEIFKKQ